MYTQYLVSSDIFRGKRAGFGAFVETGCILHIGFDLQRPKTLEANLGITSSQTLLQIAGRALLPPVSPDNGLTTLQLQDYSVGP